jgi:hypothetical protein
MSNFYEVKLQGAKAPNLGVAVEQLGLEQRLDVSGKLVVGDLGGRVKLAVAQAVRLLEKQQQRHLRVEVL